MKTIYLDNAATTRVYPKVAEKMHFMLTENYANPLSPHSLGQKAMIEINAARKIIAHSLNVNSANIVFTSGGSEANNLAIKGIAFGHMRKNNAKSASDMVRKKIITTKIEHESVISACNDLEMFGFEVVRIKCDKEGFINLDSLKKEIDEDTLIVSIIHANNEIGTIQDIAKIAELCTEKSAFFHTDCVQSFTKHAINLKNVDLASISAHKIHGPKGTGALYVNDRAKKILSPIINGGGQEFSLRAGTHNSAGIAGFAEAVKLCKYDADRMKSKMKILFDSIIRECSEIARIEINGPSLDAANRLQNILNLRFIGIDSYRLLLALDSMGVMVSQGSACSTGSSKASHVLKALSLSDDDARSSIRISISEDNSDYELMEVGRIFADSIKKIRE